MFVEMSAEAFEKLKKKLEEMGITDYTVKDCNVPGDSIAHVHVEFGDLPKSKAEELAKDIHGIYGLVAEKSNEEKAEEISIHDKDDYELLSDDDKRKLKEEKEIDRSLDGPATVKQRKMDQTQNPAELAKLYFGEDPLQEVDENGYSR